MNLQTHVPDEMWKAIASPYEAQNFTHAVLEGTHYISSILRDRAGVDGDGASLVGQALGGESPKLRLNSLQTETEQNIQKGTEQLLRGVYAAIRNPRSHEQITDTKEEADAILHFLGYLSGILTSSKEAFTVAAFLDRVRDAAFVGTKRYGELLALEIPAMKRSDALIQIYKIRRTIDLAERSHLIRALLDLLTPHQTTIYLSVVSEELRITNEEAAIRSSIQMLTPELWPQLTEVSRLRTENKLIIGIAAGEILATGKTTAALATWSNSFLKAFTMRSAASDTLARRLEHEDIAVRHYVAKYFMKNLPEVAESKPRILRFVKAITSAIEADDQNVRQSFISNVRSFPADWQALFAEHMQKLTDLDNPAVHLSDGTPLLSSPANDDDDDIPF